MNPNAYSGLLGNYAPMTPRTALPQYPVGSPIQAQPGLPGQNPLQSPPVMMPNQNYLAQLLRARNGMQPSMQ